MNEQDSASIYHEKQMKELCALHALNNLLQDRKAFSKKELDNICITLSPARLWNPHRSMLGLGNYDVNVIMAALQSKNFETLWFDKRRSVDCLLAGNISGFILNIPSDFKLGLLHLPFRRKHWIAIRRVHDLYYNLDSKLDGPEYIGHEQQLRHFLTVHLESKDTELLLVVTPEVYQSGLWKRDQTDCQIQHSDDNIENLWKRDQMDCQIQHSDDTIENRHNADVKGKAIETGNEEHSSSPNLTSEPESERKLSVGELAIKAIRDDIA